MNIPKTTKYLVNIALILLTIYLFSKLTDFLKPMTKVLFYILVPLILSTYIYYALKPIKTLLTKVTKRENLSSVIAFLIFILVLVLLFSFIGGLLVTQLTHLITNIDFTKILESNSDIIDTVKANFKIEEFTKNIGTQLQKYLSNFPKNISGTFSGVFNSISEISTQILLVLLAVFYFLKDETRIKNGLSHLMQGTYYDELYSMATKVNNTLKTYISGQLLVACVLGALMFIAYLIIKLPYAFLMAALALITNFIPFIGPILGALPAVLIALTINYTLAIKVIVVSVIVQQLESNFITPNIMGSKLDIHPFVVIIVILVCMNLFGVLGALIGTPLYLSIVILIKGVYKIYKKKKSLEMKNFNLK